MAEEAVKTITMIILIIIVILILVKETDNNRIYLFNYKSNQIKLNECMAFPKEKIPKKITIAINSVDDITCIKEYK